MNFVLPPDVQRLLQEQLRNGLGKSNYKGAINVLLACPELARDPVTHTLLEQVLLDPALGYRWYAARILATLGEPLGPLHLVYNSLAVHPVLGRDHTKISGWHECALPFARELDARCLDLLIGEMTGPRHGFHGVTLALAGANPSAGQLHPWHAAFAAAWNGDAGALPQLFEWLQEDRGPALAAWALLRLVRTEDGRRCIGELADERHPLYDAGRPNGSLLEYRMLPMMRFGQVVAESQSGHPLADGVVARYLDDFDGNPADGEAVKGALASGDLGPHFVSAGARRRSVLLPGALLAVLADLFPSDLAHLAALQEPALRRYVADRAPVDPKSRPHFIHFWDALRANSSQPGLRDTFYQLEGFDVRLDAEDFVRLGTVWIKNPFPRATGIH